MNKVLNRRRLGAEKNIGRCVVGTYGRAPDFRSLMRKLETEALLRANRSKGAMSAEAEEAFLVVVAPCLVVLAEPDRWKGAVIAWIRRKCPKLVAGRGMRWVHAFAAGASAMPFLSAQAAGDLLRVTGDQRRVLGLTTIWVAGWTRAAYEQHRRETRRASARNARTAKGATPRNLSITALAPWKDSGIGRAEWYARHSSEERRAIVARLRGQIRSHPPSLPGRVGNKGGYETVHGTAEETRGGQGYVEKRVAGYAPEGAPVALPASAALDDGGAVTPGLKPERRRPAVIARSVKEVCHG